MDLERIFEVTAKKMKLEWEQVKDSLDHSGNKGTALETIVIEYLRPYLPRNLGMISGEIAGSNGISTKQMDIIIYDEFKAPRLFDKGNIRVIPIECVYAVIEVKANINSQDVVDEIFENMSSVKNLEKTGFHDTKGNIIHTVDLYGKDWSIWPVHYFVFAIDSMKLETLANKIHEKHESNNCEVSKRIDCVCVLEKGVIMNRLESSKYSALPTPNSVLTWHESENPFLFFYYLISRFVNQAWIPNFDFIKFAKHISFKSKTQSNEK
jgi:hypothetical protein